MAGTITITVHSLDISECSYPSMRFFASFAGAISTLPTASVRDAKDKSVRVAARSDTAFFVCGNMAFHGDYTPGTMFPS